MHASYSILVTVGDVVERLTLEEDVSHSAVVYTLNSVHSEQTALTGVADAVWTASAKGRSAVFDPDHALSARCL